MLSQKCSWILCRLILVIEWHNTTANVVVNDLDQNFQGQTFQVAILSSKRWKCKHYCEIGSQAFAIDWHHCECCTPWPWPYFQDHKLSCYALAIKMRRQRMSPADSCYPQNLASYRIYTAVVALTRTSSIRRSSSPFFTTSPHTSSSSLALRPPPYELREFIHSRRALRFRRRVVV